MMGFKGKYNLKTLTLEVLENHPSHIAQVWRGIRAAPAGLSLADAGKEIGARVQSTSVTRLVREGWVKTKGGKGNRWCPRIYIACTDVQPKERDKPGERLARARRRLTKVSKRAHDARYTAISGKMSLALAAIEKEVVEIRETLYLR